MRYPVWINVLALLLAPLSAVAAPDLQLQPQSVALRGPHARQRLLAFSAENGRVVGDVSADVQFATSSATVATVAADGTVTPTGDGEAVITATHGGKTATARVTVTKFKEPADRSFRNHVV